MFEWPSQLPPNHKDGQVIQHEQWTPVFLEEGNQFLLKQRVESIQSLHIRYPHTNCIEREDWQQKTQIRKCYTICSSGGRYMLEIWDRITVLSVTLSVSFTVATSPLKEGENDSPYESTCMHLLNRETFGDGIFFETIIYMVLSAPLLHITKIDQVTQYSTSVPSTD